MKTVYAELFIKNLNINFEALLDQILSLMEKIEGCFERMSCKIKF